MSSLSDSSWPRWVLSAVVVITLVTAAILAGMGQDLWCARGDLAPWAGDIWSAHNSQHLADPYTFTHMLHGVVFYGIFALGLARWLGEQARLVVSVGVEALWELLENSPMVIDRYRESATAQDYYGDSVANSVADIGACVLGYLLVMEARRRGAPWWSLVLGFFAVEAFLTAWVRDSLILSSLSLIYPIDAISAWQAAGAP